jgi:hypothetical protein
MTLSALRTNLPFRLASIHVRAHQDEHCEFSRLPRPAQLNVLADELASEVLADFRAADQPTEFYPLPVFRVYLRDGTGHITSQHKRSFSVTKDSTQDTIQANDGRANLLHSPGRKAILNTVWKDRCTSANAPGAESLDKSSARTRQTKQNLVTMAYANSPLMLAIDRRIFDIPMEERLHLRTSDLVAWPKTMLPTIRLGAEPTSYWPPRHPYLFL